MLQQQSAQRFRKSRGAFRAAMLWRRCQRKRLPSRQQRWIVHRRLLSGLHQRSQARIAARQRSDRARALRFAHLPKLLWRRHQMR